MSFPHLLVIFVIALVVLGPQKLPKLVAQVGRWAGKARAMARQFREQLENEINLDELNKTASKPAAPTPPSEDPPATPWAPSAPVDPHPAVTDAAAEPAPVAPQPLTADDAVGEQHIEATPADAPAPVVADASWTSDVHDHRLHPPAEPETQSPTPIVETHERGA